VLVASALLASLSACRQDDGSPVGRRPVAFAPSTEEYLPGIEADVYVPASAGPVPIVVMVPGGAWRTADRSGLTPLAERLAGAGMLVVNATHRAADAGARFPSEVQDVVCSVGFAAARAAAGGQQSGPVVLLGHSSGAHLAALAALAGAHFRGACPHPPASVDGLIGLAGLYDPSAVTDMAEPLFGVPASQNPQRWRDGNALTWASAVASLPVLLAHGDRDDLVPMSLTMSFAAALRVGGHQVHVEVVPGAGHHDIYAPEVIGGSLVEWIHGPGRRTGAG
jgi:acetyl esterase/lipase